MPIVDYIMYTVHRAIDFTNLLSTRYLQSLISWETVHIVSLAALVPFEKLIKETADYCKQRTAFGSPILSHQSVYFRLAELSTEVELLRALIYRAVSKLLMLGLICISVLEVIANFIICL